ncbi:hypothetical protein ACFE04_011276 [Oxalis oulophora]
MSRQFKLVGSLLGVFYSSLEDCEVAASPSLARMAVNQEVVTSSSPDELMVDFLEAHNEGVAEVTLETKPESSSVDAEDQVCPYPVPKELSTIVGTQTEVTPNVEEVLASTAFEVRVNLEENHALMSEASGGGKNVMLIFVSSLQSAIISAR